jgi:hypothetical protein
VASEEDLDETDMMDEPEDMPDDFGELLEGKVEKKRKRGLKKIPVDRSQDKRRVGKGLQKFIDITVPEELLAGLDENLQALMKKAKGE